ncbi:MAG TPA: hypothetical protein VIG47_05480 [Gemmatimonadaceae bacterium]|jgi:hypothetical protein
MPSANNEKLTGPHSGWFGVSSALLLTLITWGFLYFLHVKLWHDPMNPMSPNEHSTVIQPAATTPATATVTKPTPH